MTHGVVFDDRPVTPTLVERLRGRWRGTGGFTHWSVLGRAAAAGGGSPRFLVRVDDYPRWDLGPEVFAQFHAILRDASIRYVLGAIPLPPIGSPPARVTGPAGRSEGASADPSASREWTAEERAVLAEALSDLDLALHGLTHRAEGVARNAEALAAEIDEGLARLAAMGHRPRAYIPPFNAVDRPALAVLSRRFPVVCGGPESVRWLGRLPGPCRLENAWFLPSYPPAYGRAAGVLPFVRAARRRPVPLLVPLTLHWAWEVEDRFEGVRRLADALAGATVTLEAWERGAAW